MSAPVRRLLRIAFAGLVVAACSNAGADNVLTVTGAGQVRGLIYLDRNGDTVFSGLPDGALALAKIRLVARGTLDTVGRATSDTGSVFAGLPVNFGLTSVPAGTYSLVVDTLTIPHDTMRITRIDSTLTIGPGDTAFVRVAVTYPAATPTDIRTLPLRTRVFVVGVALANGNTFGDSANSIADTVGAIRVIKIKPTVVVGTGDSLRVLGSVDTLSGQRVLLFQGLFTLGINATTPITVLTVAQAKTANGGAADAGLVGIQGRVVVLDTATGPGGSGRVLQVTDTTGSLTDTLEVHLDSLAGFDSLTMVRDTVGARLRLTGLLLPSTTTPGRWVLKPRATSDQL